METCLTLYPSLHLRGPSKVLRHIHTQWCTSSSPAYICIYITYNIHYIYYTCQLNGEYFVWNIERCWCHIIGENEVIVGATVTGDAPTASELSTILLPTKVPLILVVWRYLQYYAIIILKSLTSTVISLREELQSDVTRELRCSKLSVTVQKIVQANSKTDGKDQHYRHFVGISMSFTDFERDNEFYISQ